MFKLSFKRGSKRNIQTETTDDLLQNVWSSLPCIPAEGALQVHNELDLWKVYWSVNRESLIHEKGGADQTTRMSEEQIMI